MRKIPSRVLIAAALGITLWFPSCASVIYDDAPPPDNEFEFDAVDSHFSALNSTRYTTWIYIDLEEGKAVAVNEYGDERMGEVPGRWHFALHRFDVKTNGAEVLETRFATIDALAASGSVPTGTFAGDVWTDDKVAYDMSGMMSGNILYAETDYNAEMSKWMNVDTSGMPPSYTPSNKVYLLRLDDGTMAAVRFTGYRASNTNGYISFDYLHPLEF